MSDTTAIDEEEASGCGTYAGYQRHRNAAPGQRVECQPCREANARYMKEYRARERPLSDRIYRRARSRALARLVARFDDDFRRFLSAELEKARAELSPPEENPETDR